MGQVASIGTGNARLLLSKIMFDCCNITGYSIECNENYVNPIISVKFNPDTKEVFDNEDNLIGTGTLENGILKIDRIHPYYFLPSY